MSPIVKTGNQVESAAGGLFASIIRFVGFYRGITAKRDVDATKAEPIRYRLTGLVDMTRLGSTRFMQT